MKKNLAILTLVTLTILSGCASTPDNKEIESVDNQITAEFIDEITDDNKMAKPEEAFKDLDSAIQKVYDLTSYSVENNSSISLKTDTASLSSSESYNVKNEETIYEFTANSKMSTQMGEVDPMDQTTDIEGYLKDDMLYFASTQDGETVKLKEETKFADFQDYLHSSYFFMNLEESNITAAASQELADGKVYKFDLDNSTLTDYLMQALEAEELTIDEGSDIKLSKSDLNVKINSDGYIVAYNMNVEANFNISEKPATFAFSVNSTFSNINETKVTEKSEEDFTDYMDAQQYMSDMETAYNEALAGLQGEEVTTNE